MGAKLRTSPNLFIQLQFERFFFFYLHIQSSVFEQSYSTVSGIQLQYRQIKAVTCKFSSERHETLLLLLAIVALQIIKCAKVEHQGFMKVLLWISSNDILKSGHSPGKIASVQKTDCFVVGCN